MKQIHLLIDVQTDAADDIAAPLVSTPTVHK